MTQFFRKYDFLYVIIVASIPLGISISSVLTLIPTFCIFWKLFEFVKEYDSITTQLRQISKVEDETHTTINKVSINEQSLIIIKSNNGLYDIHYGNDIIHTNQIADDTIRYLSFIASN